MKQTDSYISQKALRMRSPKFGQIAEVRQCISDLNDIVNLGYGEPDFDTPVHIREAGKKAINEGHTHYILPVEGLTPLREAITAKLSEKNQIDADPDEILVISGVQEGINVALQTIINPGDEVILPSPYYYADPLGVVLAGGVPVYTHLNAKRDFRIDPEDVRAKISSKTKALLFISPNCPTGSVLTIEDLEALAQLAVDHDLMVITDEIYESLVYDGVEHISIASLPGMHERVIALFGFSKAYAMTGWRIGYMFASRKIMPTLIEVHSQLALCTNSIAQFAALSALTDTQDFLEEMRSCYEKRRNLFVDGLNQLGFKIRRPRGSFYAYADVSSFADSGFDFAKKLAREGRVLGYPGTAFTPDDSGKKFIRFAYTRSESELEKALERTAAVLKIL